MKPNSENLRTRTMPNIKRKKEAEELAKALDYADALVDGLDISLELKLS
jgi:hypothetical protein